MTLFYLFNQLITLSPKLLDASAEIKVFTKSDLHLPGSSKECQFSLCYLGKSQGEDELMNAYTDHYKAELKYIKYESRI